MPKLNIVFEQVDSERLYPINYEFVLKQGKKSPKNCRIINYAITYNFNGKIIDFAYVLQYEFLGQSMVYNVSQTTIDIATNNGWKNLK